LQPDVGVDRLQNEQHAGTERLQAPCAPLRLGQQDKEHRSQQQLDVLGVVQLDVAPGSAAPQAAQQHHAIQAQHQPGIRRTAPCTAFTPQHPAEQRQQARQQHGDVAQRHGRRKKQKRCDQHPLGACFQARGNQL